MYMVGGYPTKILIDRKEKLSHNIPEMTSWIKSWLKHLESKS